MNLRNLKNTSQINVGNKAKLMNLRNSKNTSQINVGNKIKLEKTTTRKRVTRKKESKVKGSKLSTTFLRKSYKHEKTYLHQKKKTNRYATSSSFKKRRTNNSTLERKTCLICSPRRQKKLIKKAVRSKAVGKNKSKSRNVTIDLTSLSMDTDKLEKSAAILPVKVNKKKENNLSGGAHEDNFPLLNFRCVDEKTGEHQIGIPLHKQFIPFIEPLVRQSPSQMSTRTVQSNKSHNQKMLNEDEEYLKEFVKMYNITAEDVNFVDSQNVLPSFDNNYFWI